MVLPPAQPDGLGVVLLNSNAETHFSFTNALGLVAEEGLAGGAGGAAQYPRARFVVALHHHPSSIRSRPRPSRSGSDTTLIKWQPLLAPAEAQAHRLVAMHGHRHVDWIGRCGPLRIVSAPSPVMEATNDEPTPSTSTGSARARMAGWR